MQTIPWRMAFLIRSSHLCILRDPRLITTGFLLLLLIRSESLQILQIDLAQRLLIRSVQKNLRNNLISLFPSSLKSLQPPARAQTPLATTLHASNRPQVVAILGGEIEELLCDFCCDGVVAEVGGGYFAVTVAEVAGHGRGGVEGEGLLENYGLC